MAGTAPAAKAAELTPKQRAALQAEARSNCEKLLTLHVDNTKLFGEMDVLEAILKEQATRLGDSFRETFPNGYVGASPRKDKKFNGNVPEINAAVWNGMTKKEQYALIRTGLVKVVEDWSRADYGRVTVKVLKPAAP